MQIILYFIAAVILSTDFVWSFSITTPIFTFGNMYIYFLNAELFELEGPKAIVVTALKSGI